MSKSEPERYRKVSQRIHADEKYLRLTAPPPCGQVLWWHLIAGEQTGIIPGLMKIGEMAFSEQLGWPIEGFRKAFQEVFREGMVKADWKARLIWVPNALKHNMPENPNVIKRWAKEWPFIPECELKVQSYHHMREVLKGFSIAFGKAFEEAFDEPLSKTIGKQEQEQEQEQEQYLEFDSEVVGNDVVPQSAPQKKFVRPSLDEVRAYCEERHNHVDPEKFVNYYTSNGWKVGRNAMKDWKSAVRTWEKNSTNGHTNGSNGTSNGEIKCRPLSDAEVDEINRKHRERMQADEL